MRKHFWCAFTKYALALLIAACGEVLAQETTRPTFNFETGNPGEVPSGWRVSRTGWTAKLQTGGAFAGKGCARLELPADSIARGRFGSLSFNLNAEPYRGKVVRYRAAVRITDRLEGDGRAANLWMRVDRKGSGEGFWDNAPPIRDKKWRHYEIIGGVAKDATQIDCGIRLHEKGPVWIDEVSIEIIDEINGKYPDEIIHLSTEKLANPEIKHFKMKSQIMSDYWGRDMIMHAGVVLPPQSILSPQTPICYNIHGFGGNHWGAWNLSMDYQDRMRQGDYPPMMYVYLNAQFSMGHHEFASSANNGPWGDALITEFIPALEKAFGGERKPEARFLTGHSSGGWSSLWLQVTYPDFFNGTWSTAPDPVDFRDFSGVDIYTAKNLYVDAKGDSLYLEQANGKLSKTFWQYTKEELARHAYGGQMFSFDAVFSPRGEDGRPMPLYDRDNDAIDSAVAQAWKKYDINLILKNNWATLGPKLKGKLHVWCGLWDTYRLEGAVKLMKEDLQQLGSDADILLVPERDHSTLFRPHPEYWPNGMMERIHREMWARYNVVTAEK